MGFGYVLLGYLASFIFYMVTDAIGLVGLAPLLGYCIMAYGLWMLSHYHKSFRPALFTLIPLSICALITLFNSLIPMLAIGAGMMSYLQWITSSVLLEVLSWINFVSVFAFQLLLLYGIRMIARQLELKLIDTKAIRNAVFVAFYGILYLVTRALPVDLQVYMALPLNLLQIIYGILNLLLLLNCAKDICPAGEEDQPERPSRFDFLNRMADTMKKNKQKAIDDTKREAEQVLAQRHASRQKKKHKKKK